ncbi:hypothetical protein JCM14469_22500 [Desulfatiferula olefinivorans]
MKLKPVILTAGVLIAAGVTLVAVRLWLRPADGPADARPAAVVSSRGDETPLPSPADGPGSETAQKNAGAVPLNETDLIDWAVTSLKAEFADTISRTSSQAELIRLRLFLAERYPKTWSVMLRTILSRAFPDQVDAILSTLDRMDAYQAWLESQKTELSLLDHEKVMERLWAKRRELFGPEADAVWAEETQTEAIHDVLDIVADAYDTTLDEKLDLYVQAIATSTEDPLPGFLANRKIYLTRAFLRLDSVQDNLKALSDADREQHIRDVRRTLGFSEEELDRLARTDAKNEQRWQQGYRYMDERAALLSTVPEHEQEEALAALREKHFDTKARTIAAEESQGFYRFTRPRIYGCN